MLVLIDFQLLRSKLDIFFKYTYIRDIKLRVFNGFNAKYPLKLTLSDILVPPKGYVSLPRDSISHQRSIGQ